MYYLYLGDCLEIAKQIPDKSINLQLLDPPYNIKKAAWDKWKTVESYVEWMGKLFKEVERTLADNGSFYFWHNDFEQMAELQHWIKINFLNPPSGPLTSRGLILFLYHESASLNLQYNGQRIA